MFVVFNFQTEILCNCSKLFVFGVFSLIARLTNQTVFCSWLQSFKNSTSDSNEERSKRSFVEVCGMGEISWTGFGMAGQKSREVKKPTEKSILIWTWKYLSIKSGRNWKEPRPIWNDFWRNQTATDWTFWNEWLLLEPRSPKFVMMWTFYLYKYPDKGSFLNLECDVCKTHLWCSLRLGVFHQPLTAFQQAFDPLVNNPLFTLIPQILWRLYSACFLSWTNNKNNSIWWRPFCSLHKSSSLIRFRCPLLK